MLNKNVLIKFFAEGFLIIVSILAAFFVDDWKDTQEQNKKEMETIDNLISDIKSDLQEFKNDSVTAFILISSFNALIDFEEYDLLEDSTKIKHSNNACNVIQTLLHSQAFEVLKANGTLNVINNSKLQNQIVSYYSQTNQLNAINGEQLRVFRDYMNELTTTGHVVADERNIKLIAKAFNTTKARGMIQLRLLYCNVYTNILNAKNSEAKELIKALLAYKSSQG
jgi:hypothetical protein